MNLLGVGILEFIVIIVLGLIVFGPERLPEIGRFLGRQLAKFMAWQYQSPEAQMINQIRHDFEREIIELRDEMIRTRQTIDISADVYTLQQETQALLSLQKPPEGTIVAGNPARKSALSLNDPLVPEQYDHTAISAELPEPSGDITPSGSDQAIASNQFGAASYDIPTPTHELPYVPFITAQEYDALQLQIQALMADIHALQKQLKAKGLLEPNWEPPSHGMHHETVSS